MISEPDIEPVLRTYDAEYQPRERHYLAGGGGFSGSHLWRLETRQGTLVLRRWPAEHPSSERLAFIHRVLAHCATHGFTQIPLPLPARSGATWVEAEGHRWELARWLPGEANYHLQPSSTKLAAAMKALARFHLATSSFPPPVGEASGGTVFQDRKQRLERLATGECGTELRTSYHRGWPSLRDLGERLLPLAQRAAQLVLPKMNAAAARSVPLQPCLRDVWHDHVLFTGDRVTGLIDFGAMRIASVAGDVARLLGSLAHDDLPAWQAGIRAYTQHRPLSDDELHFVRLFDESTVAWAGVQWLVWVCIEGRNFKNRAEVERRCLHWLDRLETMLANRQSRGLVFPPELK